MNALCYKIVFSKRLGSLVAVGEHTAGQGKAAGTGIRAGVFPEGAGTAVHAASDNFVGLLKSVFASVALSCVTAGMATAAGPAANTLPTGYKINNGNVAISTTGTTMTINQATDKASVNWQSFSIGSGAAVNVQQNNANSVLLNRVVGNDPSQIFGKLTANGQVILINPNGVVFGKGGSVTASAFTASTFGMTDADFLAGKHKFSHNGKKNGVTVEEGARIDTTGYVALIGASVDNQGAITTKGGPVVLASGESVTLPSALTDNIGVPLSSKVRLELPPSTINASIENSGTITTEGGQVLMQAAAVSDAVASISHTGSIDTTGAQGGAVTLQADHGIIKATGNIKTNSKNAKNKGGDIIIGRDEITGVLAKSTNVSGAKLESLGGFVETSGESLEFNAIAVKAKDWLLDPFNVNIDANAAATISSNLATTDIEIQTTTGNSLGQNTSGVGNITVNSAISKQGSQTHTLTLTADNGIDVNQSIGEATGAGALNIVMTAKGSATGTASQGININAAIATKGTVKMDGTSNNTNSNTRGITFNTGSSLTASSFEISGKSTATSSSGAHGVKINGGTSFTSTGAGESSINGTAVTNTTGITGGTDISGTSVSFNALNGSTMVVKGSNVNSGLGLRVSASGEATSITTNGNVTLGALEDNSNFSMRAGSITANSGSLKILGSSVSNFGGETISANNGTSIYIEAKPATNSSSNAVSFNNIAIKALGVVAAPGVAAVPAGNIDIIGTASTGGAISIVNNSTIEGGNIKLIGKSNASSTAVTSIAGNITASGDVTVEGTGATKHGIFSNSNITSTGGSITLLGDTTVGSGGGGGVGIGGGGTMTAAKDINITGKTVGDNAVNVGKLDAKGNITIEGTSQYKNGILVNNTIRADGVVKMTGNITANLQNSSYQGININKDITGGAVWLKGTSEGSTGIDINGSNNTVNVKVESTSGTAITSGDTTYNGVTLIGKGGNGPYYNQGVWTRSKSSIVSASKVEINGENTVAIGGGKGNAAGVQIEGTVKAQGDIQLDGNVGNPTTNAFYSSGLLIQNTVTSTAGRITANASTVTAEKIAMVISGSGALIAQGQKQNINLTANTIEFSDATATKAIDAGTTGTVNIKTKDAGVAIKLGLDDVRPLNQGFTQEVRLNQTELNKINAGNTVIGDTTNHTGGITVSNNIKTTSDTGHITLQTGGNINVSAALAAADGKNLTLQAKGDVIVGGAISQTGAGNIVIAAGLGKLAGDVLNSTIAGSGQVQRAGTGSISNIDGKTYIYTGTVADSAKMSDLNSAFNTLTLGTNAKSNTTTDLANTISGGANMQVMYREKIAVDLSGNNTLANASKTYGDVSKSTVDTDAQTALKAANNPTTGKTLSWSQNGNNFKLNSNALIDTLKVDGAAYSTADKLKASDTPYATTISSTYSVNSSQALPTLTIKKLALTGSIAQGQTTYGETLAAGAVSLTNKVGTDVVSANGVTIDTTSKTSTSGNLKAGTHANVQTVTALTGADADNYTFANVKGDYKVDQKALTGSIAQGQTTYGETLAAGAVSLTNKVGTDVVSANGVTIDTTSKTSTSGNLKAGTHANVQTVTALTGADADNYTFADVKGSYKVDQKALTGSIAQGQTTYGETLVAGAASLNNVVSTNTGTDKVSVTGVTVTTTGKTSTSGNLKAGTHTDIQSVTGITGDDAANYTFAEVKGNYTVAQKSLTALYAANNKVFDGSTAATLASATLSDIIAKDVATLDKASPTATFDTAAVGTGKTVTVAGIKLTGADAANYTVAATQTTKANITATPIKPPSPVVPTDSASRVKIPVSSANPFALASAEDLADETCNANSIENCYCEPSPLNANVDICYEPKAEAKGAAH